MKTPLWLIQWQLSVRVWDRPQLDSSLLRCLGGSRIPQPPACKDPPLSATKRKRRSGSGFTNDGWPRPRLNAAEKQRPPPAVGPSSSALGLQSRMKHSRYGRK